MIPYENLDAIAKALDDYRANGQENVLFDTRDHGNYSSYGWSRTAEMLKKADPTGISMGMLLNEMLEATIAGSQVKLSRVLREDGFIEKLKVILAIKEDLDALVAEPACAIIDRLAVSMKLVSDALGDPTSREVAICLRDAIFCMDKGLKLRWLKCDSVAVPPHIQLAPAIHQFPGIAAFTDALRDGLPFGAHLARIGVSHTAIGIKYPGRIAFLSSLSINLHSGDMFQNRADNSHMAESLDLDTPIERYPAWLSSNSGASSNRLVRTSAEDHELDRISKLPRDRLIWLAMVVEMACQRMASVDPETIVLVESASRALPAEVVSTITNLPTVIKPNWVMPELSLEEMFATMQLSPWEERYLRPALDGHTIKHFLPEGEQDMAVNFITGEVTPWPHDPHGWDNGRISETRVRMVSASLDMIGTREEIAKARQQICGKNLAKYLIHWGNYQFDQEWGKIKPWVKERLAKGLPENLKSDCVDIEGPSYSSLNGVHLYSQSRKHKTYNPRCFFDERLDVTHVARFKPMHSGHLVEIFNLKGEHELPEFLKGWTRGNSWLSCPRNFEGKEIAAPYDLPNDRWDFTVGNREPMRNRPMEGTVCLNMLSAREYLQKDADALAVPDDARHGREAGKR